MTWRGQWAPTVFLPLSHQRDITGMCYHTQPFVFNFILNHVWVCACVGVFGLTSSENRDTELPGAGVPGGCEPAGVGAGTGSKNTVCSWLLGCSPTHMPLFTCVLGIWAHILMFAQAHYSLSISSALTTCFPEPQLCLHSFLALFHIPPTPMQTLMGYYPPATTQPCALIKKDNSSFKTALDGSQF